MRLDLARKPSPLTSADIESSPSEKRRRDADQDYVFRRISNVKVAKPIQEKLMPRIIPTLPGREDEPLDVQKTSRTRRPDGLAVDKAELGFSTQQPRRFFLSKPRGVVQSQDANKKRKTAEYAVFVENQKPAKTLDRPYNANEGPRQRDELGHGDLEMIDAPQRRPGASSRSRCASHTPNLEASDGPDQATINAILQYAAEEHRLNGANHDDSPHHVYDDDKMDESEIDYVYDTFVRHESTKLSSTMDTTAASGEGIGYLVIDEEDREYWEGFGEDDDESEQDWDSEQDDENGGSALCFSP